MGELRAFLKVTSLDKYFVSIGIAALIFGYAPLAIAYPFITSPWTAGILA